LTIRGDLGKIKLKPKILLLTDSVADGWTPEISRPRSIR